MASGQRKSATNLSEAAGAWYPGGGSDQCGKRGANIIRDVIVIESRGVRLSNGQGSVSKVQPGTCWGRRLLLYIPHARTARTKRRGYRLQSHPSICRLCGLPGALKETLPSLLLRVCGWQCNTYFVHKRLLSTKETRWSRESEESQVTRWMDVPVHRVLGILVPRLSHRPIFREP